MKTVFRMGWVAVIAMAARPSSAGAQGDGFVEMFDGRTTKGWVKPFDWGEVWLEDGVVKLRSDRKFFLVSERPFGDFIFEVEVDVPVGGNSGIQFRSHFEQNRLWGYQAEVDTDENRRFSGGIYDEGRREWLHDLKDQPDAQAAFKNGGWNRYRIEAIGDHLSVYVNDVLTSDIHDSADVEGHLALQHHGESGLVYSFRNVRLRELGRNDWRPLFSGRDFAGWHMKPGGAWELREGTISGVCTKDERRHGLLVSDAEYADFTLRLKFRVVAGDSGLYFRSDETGDDVAIAGFQAELDDTLETGGLYETSGRGWVVKPDEKQREGKYQPGQWSELWVSAHGPRIVVHVDGRRTADIVDPQSRAKGHFALQLHGGQEVRVEFKDAQILETSK